MFSFLKNDLYEILFEKIAKMKEILSLRINQYYRTRFVLVAFDKKTGSDNNVNEIDD
jgi:hypothetical protein